LRGFGLKVGQTTSHRFEARVRELIDGHATLLTVADALLSARAVLAGATGQVREAAGVASSPGPAGAAAHVDARRGRPCRADLRRGNR
jgi:hypothetical protein